MHAHFSGYTKQKDIIFREKKYFRALASTIPTILLFIITSITDMIIEQGTRLTGNTLIEDNNSPKTLSL